MTATLATRMKTIQEYLRPTADYLLKFSTPSISHDSSTLRIQNKTDRLNSAIDVIYRAPRLATSKTSIKDWSHYQIQENMAYAQEYGIDKPEIRDWKWPYS